MRLLAEQPNPTLLYQGGRHHPTAHPEICVKCSTWQKRTCLHIGHRNPPPEELVAGKQQQWDCSGVSRLFLEAYVEQYFVETVFFEKKQMGEEEGVRSWS